MTRGDVLLVGEPPEVVLDGEDLPVRGRLGIGDPMGQRGDLRRDRRELHVLTRLRSGQRTDRIELIEGGDHDARDDIVGEARLDPLRIDEHAGARVVAELGPRPLYLDGIERGGHPVPREALELIVLVQHPCVRKVWVERGHRSDGSRFELEAPRRLEVVRPPLAAVVDVERGEPPVRGLVRGDHEQRDGVMTEELGADVDDRIDGHPESLAVAVYVDQPGPSVPGQRPGDQHRDAEAQESDPPGSPRGRRGSQTEPALSLPHRDRAPLTHPAERVPEEQGQRAEEEAHDVQGPGPSLQQDARKAHERGEGEQRQERAPGPGGKRVGGEGGGPHRG